MLTSDLVGSSPPSLEHSRIWFTMAGECSKRPARRHRPADCVNRLCRRRRPVHAGSCRRRPRAASAWSSRRPSAWRPEAFSSSDCQIWRWLPRNSYFASVLVSSAICVAIDFKLFAGFRLLDDHALCVCGCSRGGQLAGPPGRLVPKDECMSPRHRRARPVQVPHNLSRMLLDVTITSTGHRLGSHCSLLTDCPLASS